MLLTPEEVETKIHALVLPLLDGARIELVELNIGIYKGDVNLQVTADKPEGGITIAECAFLNRAIVEAIEADGFLGENFSVEFSSPGLDRLLVTEKDFKRNLHRKIRFSFKEAVNGKKEMVGFLAGIDKGSLIVLSNKNKGEITLLLGQISKAMLVL